MTSSTLGITSTMFVLRWKNCFWPVSWLTVRTWTPLSTVSSDAQRDSGAKCGPSRSSPAVITRLSAGSVTRLSTSWAVFGSVV